MRLAALLLVLVPATASAERETGFALDLDLGTGTANLYLRLGAGVQHGRLAALVHYEQTLITPDDPMLDGTTLFGVGTGGALRYELRRGHGLLVQAHLGYSTRWLYGDGTVTRRCTETLRCDHGYETTTPRYFDGAPWVSIDLGYRARGQPTEWPGFGVELGVGTIEIDRPGTIPDDHGPLIWVAFHAVVGAGNR